MHIFNHPKFNFLRWRWHAIALSWLIIIAGGITLATKGIPRGVEFAGGTVVIEQFDQPVSVEQVRTTLDRNYPEGGQNSVVQAYGDTNLDAFAVKQASGGLDLLVINKGSTATIGGAQIALNGYTPPDTFEDDVGLQLLDVGPSGPVPSTLHAGLPLRSLHVPLSPM